MNKNIFIKQTEVNSAGGLRISAYKQVFDDSGALVFEEPHQIMIMPLDDFDAVVAEASAHLETMGYPAITSDILDLPKALRKTALKNPLVIETQKALQKKIDDERQRAADEKAANDKAEAEAAEAKRIAEAEAAAQAKADAEAAAEAERIAAEEKAKADAEAAAAQEAHIKKLVADAVAATRAEK
jgi:hypothetical protein